MGSNAMEFRCGDARVELYKDDDGMWRVYKSYMSSGGGFTVGTAGDRDLVVSMFKDTIAHDITRWADEYKPWRKS